MGDVILKWHKADAENPGFSVWYTSPERDPDILYAIRRKKATKTFTPTVWRVFMRPNKSDKLRTIFVDEKLPTCKKFVKEWEEAIAAAERLEPAPAP